MEMYKRNCVAMKCQDCQVPLYVCPSNKLQEESMGSTKHNLPQMSDWHSAASPSSCTVGFMGNMANGNEKGREQWELSSFKQN